MDQLSIPEAVRDLHSSYLQAMGFEPEDLPLGMTFVRWWHDAAKEGLTPDGIKLVVKERIKFNATSQFKKGLELKHLIRSEEDIAIVLNEIAVVRAKMRIKLMPPGRAEAMRATGRSDSVPTDAPKHVSSVALIAELRKAAS